MKVSACIVAKNEEKMLPGLLDNLLGKVDEIVLVDGGSIDNTVEVAADYTNSIYEGRSGHPDGDRHIYVENAKYDWLLVADADERFSGHFLSNLKFLGSANGYWLARRNYYAPDKYYKHIIYPDYQLRLYNKRFLRKINDRIHSRPVIEGNLCKLPFEDHIIHLDPIFNDLSKYKRYMLKQCEENPGEPDMVMALHAFFTWNMCFLKKGCWRDGPNGIKTAYNQALYHYWLYQNGYKPPTGEGVVGEYRD